METRENINPKYTWDLTRFYKNISDVDEDIIKLQSLCKKIASQRGKLNTSDALFAYFKTDEELGKLSEKIGAYLMLRLALNGKDKDALKYSSKLSTISTKMSEMLAFLSFELSKNSDKFYNELKKEARFKDYDRDIDDLIRYKPHTLNEETEKILSGVSEFSCQGDVFDAMDNVDFKFEEITASNGEHLPLTNASYSALVSSEDAEVRRQAFEHIHKVFAGHNLSLSTNFISMLKKCHFYSKQHKFKGVRESKFFGDEIPEELLNVLTSAVNDSLKTYQEYLMLRKKVLGGNYHIYDNYVPIVKNAEIKPTYEESIEIFKKCVAPLGARYAKYIDSQVKDRYVDVFETENKDSGAFNADLNICKPYVLLNFTPSFHWLSTLAHEFGHMVNTLLINDTQPMAKRGCSIFLAEIASTVNECLLYDYLLETTADKNFEMFLLDKFLSEFNATVFRQTMFTEFEMYAHGAIEREEPITYEDLNNCYDGLQQKYFGAGVERGELAKYEWSRIPHFYRPFYVYSYATGFITATIIASRIKRDGKAFADRYIEFLASGESMDSISTLRRLGIDILDKKTFDEGFAIYKDRLIKLKKLLEK